MESIEVFVFDVWDIVGGKCEGCQPAPHTAPTHHRPTLAHTPKLITKGEGGICVYREREEEKKRRKRRRRKRKEKKNWISKEDHEKEIADVSRKM